MKHHANAEDARRRVHELNLMVVERFEHAVRTTSCDLTPPWIQSLNWYLKFELNRARQYTDDFLSDSTLTALILRTILNNHVTEADHPDLDDAAAVPLFRIKESFGMDRFDHALTQHEPMINLMGEDIQNRLSLYHELSTTIGAQVDAMQAAPKAEHANVTVSKSSSTE